MMTGMVRSRDIIILSSIIEVVVSASAKNHAVEFSSIPTYPVFEKNVTRKEYREESQNFIFIYWHHTAILSINEKNEATNRLQKAVSNSIF